MKCLVLILLAMFGQVGVAQDRGAAQAFVGCYELKVEGRPRNDYGNQLLPNRFELKTERVYGGFAAKNLDLRIHGDFLFSHWNVEDDGSLALGWSTGYVGWAIQLYRSGVDDFYGTARFWTDTGSKHPALRVVVRTAKCGESGDKS